MAFDWLNKFQHDAEKDLDYAEKTLAGYRLGMRAKGSIIGVTIQVAPNCCEAAHELPTGKLYDPSQVPHLPMPDCPLGRRCGCVYRPVMSYQQGDEP
jgi:hypothetical protein